MSALFDAYHLTTTIPTYEYNQWMLDINSQIQIIYYSTTTKTTTITTIYSKDVVHCSGFIAFTLIKSI